MENEIRGVVPIQRVIFDGILLMCVGFPILFLFLFGDPYRRGFFCYDESLRHPFHESTVPSIYLYFIGIGLTSVVMLTTEFLTHRNDERKFLILGIKLPMWIWHAYCVIGVFLFGAGCSQLTTDIMKYTIGRLRPHFYTVCQPNIDCNDPKYTHLYHVDFYCTNPDYSDTKRILKEMRLSFPSGHSSFSMYSMLYLSIYIQSRMTWSGSKLLKHTLQFLAITSSVYTGMTRVSDYKHHWSDVLSGFLIGATTASLVASYVSTLFSNRIYKNESTTELSILNMNGRRSLNHAV